MINQKTDWALKLLSQMKFWNIQVISRLSLIGVTHEKLMIAAAGAGKTTYLVNQASEVCDGKVLITTFTIENSVEIKKKLTNKYGFIPSNIIVKTWFDFSFK